MDRLYWVSVGRSQFAEGSLYVFADTWPGSRLSIRRSSIRSAVGIIRFPQSQWGRRWCYPPIIGHKLLHYRCQKLLLSNYNGSWRLGSLRTLTFYRCCEWLSGQTVDIWSVHCFLCHKWKWKWLFFIAYCYETIIFCVLLFDVAVRHTMETDGLTDRVVVQ